MKNTMCKMILDAEKVKKTHNKTVVTHKTVENCLNRC